MHPTKRIPPAGRRWLCLLVALPLILAALPRLSEARGKLPALPQKIGYAGFPGAPLFVDQHYVQEQRTRPNVVLIDVRPREAYNQGHLPGAISIPAHLWRTDYPHYHLFHQQGDPARPYDVERYEQFLGDRGISHTQQVIVYGDPGTQHDVALPVFVLDWLGHAQLHFFDGNAVQLWQDSGFALDQRVPAQTSTVYKAHPRPEAIWNREQILERLDVNDPKFVLWDCRSPEEFSGAVQIKGAQYAGHIAGAVHFHQEDLYRNMNTLQVRFYHEARILLAKIGVEPGKRIVVYSHDGGRAAYAYLLLRALGCERVALYDHSWLEWQQDQLLPRRRTFDGAPEIQTRFPRRKPPQPAPASPEPAPDLSAPAIPREWYHPRAQ